MYRMLGCVYLMWIVAILAQESPDHRCLKTDRPAGVVVGFDIGITHGTASVGFTNGSFQDVIGLKTGPAYQARMMQRLRDGGLVDIEQERSQNEGLAKQSSNTTFLARTWNKVQLLFQIDVPIKTSSDGQIGTYDSNEAQSDLEALITVLKASTENFLHDQIENVTLTTPRFLPEAHKTNIELALSKVSLKISSCCELEDSIIASTIATRFSQQPTSKEINVSSAEWLLGPFHMEEVVVVEYTKNLLVFSVYELYIGKTTWIEEGFRHLIAVGDIFRNDIDPTFWNNLRIGMRKIATQRESVPDRTLRLVLQGSSIMKPTVVSLVESVIGKILPSPSRPYAVHVKLNEEECKAQRDRMRQRDKTFLCYLGDYDSKWWAKDYERDLLESIKVANESSTKIDGEFLASRGAAMMALHFFNLSCQERQQARKASWRWDNNRSSTRMYPDLEAERLLRSFGVQERLNA